MAINLISSAYICIFWHREDECLFFEQPGFIKPSVVVFFQSLSSCRSDPNLNIVVARVFLRLRIQKPRCHNSAPLAFLSSLTRRKSRLRFFVPMLKLCDVRWGREWACGGVNIALEGFCRQEQRALQVARHLRRLSLRDGGGGRVILTLITVSLREQRQQELREDRKERWSDWWGLSSSWMDQMDPTA